MNSSNPQGTPKASILNPSALFRLSQGQLNLLTTCPRKFQHTYLEQLGSPPTPEQQERLAWGSRFHLLMQQRELGLPVEFLAEEDTHMYRCFTGFISAAPELFTPSPPGESGVFREAEHCRTLIFQGYLLTVVYDLLLADDLQAQILDWKTYPIPQNEQWLAQNWQTRLYPFVLAETSSYLPEQISMSYWFVQSVGSSARSSQCLKFLYDGEQHRQTQQDLTRMLSQLTVWLERYEAGELFPQVSAAEGKCRYCGFAVRCQRDREGPEDAIGRDWLPNLSNIQEVSL